MASDQTRERREQAGFRIHGRVQGVGFRWWTRRTAGQLGIAGSVRNLPDGTVEVRAAGPADAMREFESRLRRGPRSASVERIDRFEVDDIFTAEFRIEP
ncbi:MAG TPA: acylphosphatase [Gemmatimonadota bacterium]|nr:acylphosphatase [Gemmatimonadota bacterium]